MTLDTKNNRTEKTIGGLFFLLIFLFLNIFFQQIHPFALFDSDNWAYIASKRDAVPIWGFWNPIKVFPETVMGYVSDIGVFCLYPITKNYISSITMVHGCFISLIITAYLFMVWLFFRKKYDISCVESLIISFLFLICNFWIFKRQDTGNQHMFYDISLNTYYNYALPALINSSLVLYFAVDPFLFKKKENKIDYIRSGFIILLVYFAVFSNIFQSCILVTYIGIDLILVILDEYKKIGIKRCIKDNMMRIIIISAWLISLIFEYNGGRAAQSSNTQISLLKILKALIIFLRDNLNVYFLAFAILVLIVGATVRVKNVRGGGKMILSQLKPCYVCS